MRWKLLILVSAGAAMIGIIIWSALIITLFGSARVMAQSDWRLLGSLTIPLAVAAFAGFFVYRHTARKRKTQAIMTVLLSLLLTPVAYLAGWALLSDRLYIPTTSEVRHAR
ncbi:MAG TPA: hypothetical protein VN696_00690 [Pyrinomonadaceae bacterium]|nr:hypothetical protein [Pyrinomonadaceae bacterium]